MRIFLCICLVLSLFVFYGDATQSLLERVAPPSDLPISSVAAATAASPNPSPTNNAPAPPAPAGVPAPIGASVPAPIVGTGTVSAVNTAPTFLASANASQTNATQSAAPNNLNPFEGKPTSASYSNDIPPAYLTWKKPIPNQTFPPLYKIGVSNITFEWTVDPQILKVQPVNITVALANPQKQTFTAAIVPGTATSAHWDLARLPPGQPLMVGYYTVWVYDQRGPKAFPSPGWLMPDARLVVAMYSTEAYVARTDSMFCPTCYLGSAYSLRESFSSLSIGLAVAIMTSAVLIYSI
ncbi:hypothetical protein BDF14DRAFT_1838791 [Spinellus fusiger]|nr:hypothetical protein BDF14DRAFT_1838791 [Spinellus fusiger]